MLLNIFPTHLGLAMRKGFTLHEGISASEVVLSIDNLHVGENLVAPILRIDALELQFLELAKKLLLHRDKLRAFAHHGTGSGLSAKLVQAPCVIVPPAFNAGEGVNEDGLTESAE
jgi:hypothetical protein